MSHKQQILEYLMTGATVSDYTDRDRFNCNSITQRIGDLRRDGYDIRTFTKKLDNGKIVGEYVLFAKDVRRKF